MRIKSTNYELITMIHEHKNTPSSIYRKTIPSHKCETISVIEKKLTHIILKSYD